MSPAFADGIDYVLRAVGKTTLMAHSPKSLVEIITSVSVSPDPSAQLSTKNRIALPTRHASWMWSAPSFGAATGKVFLRGFPRRVREDP